LNRHRAHNTQGGQQKERGKSFHNVSERKILQRSYTESYPGSHTRRLLL
jgi:hypothetical protein